MYSGTYTVTERTYDDVYFNCPGATHFAIINNNERTNERLINAGSGVGV